MSTSITAQKKQYEELSEEGTDVFTLHNLLNYVRSLT